MKTERPTKEVVSFIDPSLLAQKRLAIQKIKQRNTQRLSQARKVIEEESAGKETKRRQAYEQSENQEQRIEIRQFEQKSSQKKDKNIGVSDTDRMVFDKRFKNYLNHKEEFLRKVRQNHKKAQKGAKKVEQDGGDAQYYNEEQVLSNTGSEYQYRDADDMQAAYDQMMTGKKRKGGSFELFHGELFENEFREAQFQILLELSSQEEKASQSINKDTLLNYLFDDPSVMMLYSINPYQLPDQLFEFQTKTANLMNYLQFSAFLLADREPTYFQYSHQNLAEARKLGRGIKCAPIIGKWIDETGIFEFLMELYHSLDLRGDGLVDKSFLARKIRKEAEEKRYTEIQVIEIVNINKRIPLNRLIYEIQFEEREQPRWSIQQFQNFLTDYKRRLTPVKDKLVTKLIMAGKYDSSYVYILSQEALQIIKDVFGYTPKYAQYFVLKQNFLTKLCNDARYKRIRGMLVRSQTNRYVVKQTVEQALVRIYAQGDTYLDLEEVLDFFTNRGRPKLVEYQVYIRNLERQLQMIEEDQRRKIQLYGDALETTQSDEEFSQLVRQKQIQRKRDKLAAIRNQNVFKHGKKFNVTIPRPFDFDLRDKHKKTSIRQQKVQEMLDQKERQFKQSMKPFKSKQVPEHVKDHNLYSKILKDQQRQRRERLQKFRLQIMSQVHCSQRLCAPKHIYQPEKISKDKHMPQARPMPWYCQVNLLDRINNKKQQRREQILQQIITRNTQFDLPEGVINMIERSQAMQQKKNSRGTRSTSFGTFQPSIRHHVPNFEMIHQHLKIDLDNAKHQKEPIKIEPFSFDGRPARSRTTHEAKKELQQTRLSQYQKEKGEQQDYKNIPKTQKFQALVQMRRKQKVQRQRAQSQQKRAEAVRRLRQKKFAPYVRKVLKESNVDISKSRLAIVEKIRQFKREQKRKKIEYEQQMIKIYSKVFQRPLLAQNGGVYKQGEQNDASLERVKLQGQPQKIEQYYEAGKVKARTPVVRPNEIMNEDRRRAAVQLHHPGQYPPEDYDQEDGEIEEQQGVFGHRYDDEQMQYQGGNLHTS